MWRTGVRLNLSQAIRHQRFKIKRTFSGRRLRGVFSSFTKPFVVRRPGHLVVAVWNVSQLFKTELHLSVLNLTSAAFNVTLIVSLLINLSHLFQLLLCPVSL